MESEFPSKLAFLFEPHPYKVVYGGRDGVKSWSFAQALVINGRRKKLRWLCARETQKAMKDSVHKLLGDTIERLGFGSFYRVQQEGIYGENGTEFIFSGIKNAQNIKSYESCDGCWVEEAQVVSKQSWDILLPTIRKPGAEVWVSFNPELATDDTYKRWILNPPPGAMVVKTGYQDNNWLSDTSRTLIEHMRLTDPRGFAHIYGGECLSEVEGAIFGYELKMVDQEQRICSVPYDRTKPVYTAWDLGFGDPTCIWFLQLYDGFLNFIDYYSDAEKTIADHVIVLQNRGYMYAEDHLPHDAVDSIIHHRMVGSGDKSMTIQRLMQDAGRTVRIAPKILKVDSLNAGRTKFPLCRFDAVKCADGIQGLRHYQWDQGADEDGKRKPLHSWASHPADAFVTACLSVKPPRQRKEAEPTPEVYMGGAWS